MLPKEFNVKVWRDYYNRVTKLGEIIKHNVHEKVAFGHCSISDTHLAGLLAEADKICKQSAQWMNKQGVKQEPPLWEFDIKNPRTHVSSTHFAFRHLIKKCNCRCK